MFDYSTEANVSRMPSWVRQSLAHGAYSKTAHTIHQHQLHTVCESARCPNKGECWGRGTATFMLLGDVCTRACGFCAVITGRPDKLDKEEPQRIAKAVEAMGLDYVVLTSVNRDELEDGGAAIYAQTVKQLYQNNHQIGIELLTPDFRGCQSQAVDTIGGALPEHKTWVWGHNVETVPSLYQKVRKGSKYSRSLALLEMAAAKKGVVCKSSLMLGLGETTNEVITVLKDLKNVGVERISLGQYLRPGRYHLPVKKYLTSEEFATLESEARSMGFAWVKSGAMVRSSYHAEADH